MTYYITFVAISCVLIALGLALGFFSIKKKNQPGIWLGVSLLSACLSGTFYLLSITLKDKTMVAVFSTLYFLLIDLALLAFLRYIILFTKMKRSTIRKVVLWSLNIWFCVEIVCFFINIFDPFVVDFVPVSGREYAYFTYEMHALYYTHLAYCYLIVLLIEITLLEKIILVPSAYRPQFEVTAISLLVIVLINALFLFVPKNHIISSIDVSILGYTLAGAFSYFNTFFYARNSSSNQLKRAVFEDMGNAVILFDYEGRLILCNDIAKDYFSDISLDPSLTLDEFTNFCHFHMDDETDSYLFALSIQKGDGELPLGCSFRRVKDAKGKFLGVFFAFVDSTQDVDFLTGFRSYEFLDESVKFLPKDRDVPSTVVAVDINGLGLINSEEGHTAGDTAIRKLAEALRDSFPSDSYFIRCHDAILCAILNKLSEKEALDVMAELASRLEYSINYCACSVPKDPGESLKSIDKALQGLKVKKLMDKNATRHSYLASLIRALQESDADTEAHVQRTGEMMRRLCRKMNLGDVDEANLILLSILHDIGKIGVPLEILNKPGKLTPEEFEIVKSHAEKGYNICKSSPELQSIADGVLHHHERYDGKGYPSQLKGEEIPLWSRMISIVDSFDAMTHDRVYRKGMSPAEAVAELERCSGTQFDGEIVKQFVSALYEVGGPAPAPLPQSRPVQTEEKPLLMKEVLPVSYIHYYLGEDQRVVSVSRNFCDITGYSEAEAIGMCQYDFIPKEDLDEYIAALDKYLGRDEIGYFQHRFVKKDGTYIRVSCLGRRYYDSVSRSGHSELFVVPLE